MGFCRRAISHAAAVTIAAGRTNPRPRNTSFRVIRAGRSPVTPNTSSADRGKGWAGELCSPQLILSGRPRSPSGRISRDKARISLSPELAGRDRRDIFGEQCLSRNACFRGSHGRDATYGERHAGHTDATALHYRAPLGDYVERLGCFFSPGDASGRVASDWLHLSFSKMLPVSDKRRTPVSRFAFALPTFP